MTSEPSDACENVTNEPTLAVDVGPDGPTYIYARGQNVTNEPALAALVTVAVVYGVPSGAAHLCPLQLSCRGKLPCGRRLDSAHVPGGGALPR